MKSKAFQIPISNKQLERSMTHSAPVPIIEPLRKTRKKRIPKLTVYALPRHPDAARSPDESVFARGILERGDGDTIIPHRPGSLDFLTWPSVGQSC